MHALVIIDSEVLPGWTPLYAAPKHVLIEPQRQCEGLEIDAFACCEQRCRNSPMGVIARPIKPIVRSVRYSFEGCAGKSEYTISYLWREDTEQRASLLAVDVAFLCNLG